MADETDTAANKAMAGRERPAINGQQLLNRTTIKDTATQRATAGGANTNTNTNAVVQTGAAFHAGTEEAQQADEDANRACAPTTETATAAKASASAWATEATGVPFHAPHIFRDWRIDILCI